MKDVKYLPAGDSSLIISFGEDVDENINKKVLHLCEEIEKDSIKGIVELIPTYRDLCINYHPMETSIQLLREVVEKHVNEDVATEEQHRNIVEVPVIYGGEYGPDLDYLADYHKLSHEEVIKIHSSEEYRVYLIGFAPGFPYLGGLPEILHTPRRKLPKRIIAGSVGIGGKQTCVCTVTGPSGWWYLGWTPYLFSDVTKNNPTLLKAGDYIRFKPIKQEESEIYAQKGKDIWAKRS